MSSLIAFGLLASAPVGLGVALFARRPWLVAVGAAVPAVLFAGLALLCATYDLLAGVVMFAGLTLLVAAMGAVLTRDARRARRREAERAARIAADREYVADWWWTCGRDGGCDHAHPVASPRRRALALITRPVRRVGGAR